MRISLVLSLPVMLALAACAPAPDPVPLVSPAGPVQPPVPDTCGAAPFMARVGGPLTAFDAGLVKGPVRIIGPGMLVTQDYSAARINISHDDRQIITRIDCG